MKLYRRPKSSNKILILGNGFDLYLGYPFGYSDFFKSRYERFIQTPDQKDKVCTFIKTALDFLEKMKNNSPSFPDEQEDGTLTSPQQLASEKLRKLIPARVFGKKLADVLNALEIDPSFRFSPLDLIFYYPDIVSDYGKIYDRLTPDEIDWSDIESVIGFCSLALDSDTKSANSPNINSDQFKKRFEALCDLIDILYCPTETAREDKINGLVNKHTSVDVLQYKLQQAVEYVELNFTRYLNEILGKSNLPSLIAEHQQIIKENLLNDPNQTVILDFNYTDVPGNSSIIHPHGSLATDNILFGINSTVNDKLIAGNSGSFQLTKTFRGLLNRTLYSSNTSPSLPASVNELVFFGHSLNTSDYDYFYSLFDKYNLYDSNLHLTFYFALYGKADPDILPKPTDLFERTMKEQIQVKHVLPVTKLIDSYGESIKTAEHGNNLLHRLSLEDRIQIININPNQPKYHKSSKIYSGRIVK